MICASLLGAVAAMAEPVAECLRVPVTDLVFSRDDLRRAIAAGDEDARTWRDLGICRVRLGEIDEGREALERSLALDASDDLWRDAYLAAALEAVDPERAATLWLSVAPEFREGRTLIARALALKTLERLRPLPSGGAPKVAVLDGELPAALDGAPAEELRTSLRLGLRGLRVELVDEAFLREALTARGRSMDELDDPSGRIRVGRALETLGVQVLIRAVAANEAREFGLRVVPVTEDGLAAAAEFQGAADPEALDALAEIVAEAVVEAGRQVGQSCEPALLAAIRRGSGRAADLRSLDAALAARDLARVVEELSAFVDTRDRADAVAALLDGLRPIRELVDRPAVARLGDVGPAVELLENEALRRRRARRSFAEDETY